MLHTQRKSKLVRAWLILATAMPSVLLQKQARLAEEKQNLLIPSMCNVGDTGRAWSCSSAEACTPPPASKTAPVFRQAHKAAFAALQLVTGGCDNAVKVWTWDGARGEWTGGRASAFEGDDNRHGDWVLDVAWAPSLGLPRATVASCSSDGTVVFWTESGGVWRKAHTQAFEDKVWRVSWSTMGNILAVAQGDNKVSLWKEALDGSWRNLTAVGARPLAVTDNLNFGNPERPRIMGQFVGCIEGMGEACRVLDYPVVSGNVSLYNETNGEAILPTPAIGGVGLIDDLARVADAAFAAE